MCGNVLLTMPKIFGVEAGKIIILVTHHKSMETEMLKVAELSPLESTGGQREEGMMVKQDCFLTPRVQHGTESVQESHQKSTGFT